MTIAHPEPNALPVVTGADYPGLQGLDQWLAAAGNASALAEQLVDSYFVPQAYKPQSREGRPVAIANATGAILLGQSLGLDPLTSLQQIYVVHGRPGMYAKMKVALAQRAGHRITEVEYSPERATWEGQRKGSSDVVRITVTMEDAKRAGWTSNAAYGKTPADMLAARCSSRVVDRVAADALFGLSSIEDLADEPEPAPRVTARVSTEDLLKARPKPALEPSVDYAAETLKGALAMAQAKETGAALALAGEMLAAHASPEGENPETPQVKPITEVQWRAINTAFVDLSIKGDGQAAARLYVIGQIIGRKVTKGSDLTADEAQLVLDNLSAGVVQQHLATTAWSSLLPQGQADQVAEAQAHAVDVEQQIADARAAADERNAQAAADEAQAAEVDPTTGAGWPA